MRMIHVSLSLDCCIHVCNSVCVCERAHVRLYFGIFRAVAIAAVTAITGTSWLKIFHTHIS